MNFCSYFYSSLAFFNVFIPIGSQSKITCLEGDRAKKFNDKLVNDHNKYRKLHGVPSLTADSSLMKDSIEWSRELAKRGVMEHSAATNYGENLFMSWQSDNQGIRESELDPVKPWYDEIELYHPGQGFSTQTGHYTQVVWKATRKVGCGACIGSAGTFVTCRYISPGNIMGQFDENVLPPKLDPDENEADTISKSSNGEKSTPGSKNTASDPKTKKKSSPGSKNTASDSESSKKSTPGKKYSSSDPENFTHETESDSNENDDEVDDDEDDDYAILLFFIVIPIVLIFMLIAMILLPLLVFNLIKGYYYYYYVSVRTIDHS